jgi:hypothetical protein
MSRSTPRLKRRSVPRIAKVRRFDVTREELNRVIELLNERGAFLNQHSELLIAMRRDLDVQFKRIAQLQADIDAVQRMLSKLVLG